MLRRFYLAGMGFTHALPRLGRVLESKQAPGCGCHVVPVGDGIEKVDPRLLVLYEHRGFVYDRQHNELERRGAVLVPSALQLDTVVPSAP